MPNNLRIEACCDNSTLDTLLKNFISAPRVLIIDDDPDISSVIAAALEAVGCRVTTETNALRAEDTCVQCQPDLILVDMMMPGRTGLELIGPLHERRPQAIICLTTGMGDPAIFNRSLKSGAWNVLCKPYSLSDLAELVELSVRLSAALREETVAGAVSSEFSLEFPGDHLLDPADLARLIAVAASANLDLDLAYRKLPLIASELLDNAQKHGAGGKPDARYGAHLHVGNHSVELLVWDSGCGFDGAARIRELSSTAPKGKLSGLQLATSLVDEIRFEKTRSAVTVCWKLPADHVEAQKS